MKVLSPLTKNECIKIKSISVKKLKKQYLNNFNINVSSFFKNLDEIHIYECKNTGYQFYYPFYISGNSKFYEELQNFDWYYMPWKWEHKTTLEYLNGNEKILEVGSGGLGFIEKLTNEGFDITGLELNEDSIKKANIKGLKVFNESIQDYSLKNKEKYDIVCSYQVLEHITEVYSFIRAQIDCLKKGGKLIVSVPNNYSFLGYDTNNYLNMPPHHMGLWSEKSLKSLTKVFKEIKLKEVIFEPLQIYHKNYFIDTMSKYYTNKLKLSNPIFNKILNKLISKTSFLFSKKIKAFTIQVIYEKK